MATHIGDILMKLDLKPSDDANRRMLAALAYLLAASRLVGGRPPETHVATCG